MVNAAPSLPALCLGYGSSSSSKTIKGDFPFSGCDSSRCCMRAYMSSSLLEGTKKLQKGHDGLSSVELSIIKWITE